MMPGAMSIKPALGGGGGASVVVGKLSAATSCSVRSTAHAAPSRQQVSTSTSVREGLRALAENNAQQRARLQRLRHFVFPDKPKMQLGEEKPNGAPPAFTDHTRLKCFYFQDIGEKKWKRERESVALDCAFRLEKCSKLTKKDTTTHSKHHHPSPDSEALMEDVEVLQGEVLALQRTIEALEDAVAERDEQLAEERERRVQRRETETHNTPEKEKKGSAVLSETAADDDPLSLVRLSYEAGLDKELLGGATSLLKEGPWGVATSVEEREKGCFRQTEGETGDGAPGHKQQ